MFVPIFAGQNAIDLVSLAGRIARKLRAEQTKFHARRVGPLAARDISVDRKSTRLNSSHLVISYAVFCLKKKKKNASIPYTAVSSIHPVTKRTNIHTIL